MTERPLIKCSLSTLKAGQTQMALTTEIKHRLNRISDQPCRSCRQLNVSETLKINKDSFPPLIAIHLENSREDGGRVCQLKITAQVTIRDGQDKLTYKVRGLIYWNRTHFNCRMIGKTSEVYYNDGLTTGTTCIHEGKLSEMKDIHNTKEAQLTYVILSLV